ncbi:glycoside hydrolase superfamily [Aspergillus navahoensis]
MVKLLLAHGADPAAQSAWNETPLLCAVRRNRPLIVELLLEYPAVREIINVPDLIRKMTPLATARFGSPGLVSALVAAGAVDGEGVHGQAGLYRATSQSGYYHTTITSPLLSISIIITPSPALRANTAAGKLLSAAAPGLPRDMLAITPHTVPNISASLDFFNVMTYDLMNRRDNVTKHHTGIQGSITAVEEYIANGVPAEKINLGFAFYVKWFRTDPAAGAECAQNPIGCKAALMEDPATGGDLGQAGAFLWHDAVPSDLNASFQRALERGVRKVPLVVGDTGLGGVFAWGLGEDAPL